MNKTARMKFGDIVVVADDNLLIVDGKDVAITPKTMAVLMLLEHQGQTLSKAFIFEQVWQM
jgi:DNA-binding winged helix-turn-helix (wHTH) protein